MMGFPKKMHHTKRVFTNLLNFYKFWCLYHIYHGLPSFRIIKSSEFDNMSFLRHFFLYCYSANFVENKVPMRGGIRSLSNKTENA